MSHAPRPAPTRLALVIALLAHGAAQAAVVLWADGDGGEFTDRANWSPAAVPGSADTALFDLGGKASGRYTVTGLRGDVGRLVVGRDSVRFDFDRTGNLKLVQTGSQPGLVVGELDGQSGVLELVDGGTLFTSSAAIAAAAGSAGAVFVDDAGLEVSGRLTIGGGGQGRAVVSNEGLIASRSASVGNGTVLVQNSRFKVEGEFLLGDGGNATLDVVGGGKLTTGNTTLDALPSGMTFAALDGSGSNWDIDGSLRFGTQGISLVSITLGAQLTSRDATLDGDIASNLNSSMFLDNAGSRWTAEGQVDIGKAGKAAMGVSGGAFAAATSARLGVDSGAFGAVAVTQAGSRWEVAKSLEVGVLGRGQVRVRAGGVVTAGDLTVGADGSVLTFSPNSLLDVAHDAELAGLFDIDGGGITIGGTLRIVDDGRVDIDGPSTELRIGGNLIIGSPTAGAAEVDIGADSLVTVAGATTIRGNARVHLDGGTLRTSTFDTAGRFDFTRGLLELTGGGLLVGPGGGVPGWFNTRLVLGSHQQLLVSNGSLQINQGGEVVVDGTGALLHARSALLLGRGGGHGKLTIANGGELANSSLSFIGDTAGTSGEVTVRGANTRWFSGDDVVVGNLGTGTLDVLDGAYAKSADLFVGANIGSAGRMLVSGAGSTVDVVGRLFVGLADEGELDITDGGKMNVTGDGVLGSQAAGDAIVTVAGTDALLDITGPLVIGNAGKGVLTVADGGQVESAAGTLGALATGHGDVFVRGTGSRWDNAGDLLVGDAGVGALTIEDGGEVLNLAAALGNKVGGHGDVRVHGAGATWTNRHSLVIGERGTGSLRIEDGAKVTNQGVGIVGGNAGTFGDVALAGAGSQWSATGDLFVGNAGRGTLDVTAGSLLDVGGELRVGDVVSGDGELHADGRGTRVEVTRDLTVGVHGTGRVELTGGAVLDVDGNGEIASEIGSVGHVLLDGEGSHWDNALDLAVGLRGEGELDVTNGATIDAKRNALIGHQAGAVGRASVAGHGSGWTIGSTLFVGFLGDGELTVADGAKVTTQALGLIANRAGSRGRAVVTGPGSELNFGASLFVGDADQGELLVFDGARVTTQDNGRIGFHIAANGRVHVSGEGSEWTMGGSLFVANQGVAELIIANGATVTTENDNDSWVGFDAGSTGTLELTGTGSRLSTDQFVVGYRGDGELKILDGAVLSSANTWIGFDALSESSARVAGGGEWLVETLLDVGTHGTARLDIVDGGLVRTQTSYVAQEDDGAGTITIAGEGAAWFTAEDFLLGGNDDGEVGGVGAVTIRDGGLLDVGATLRLFDHSLLTLDGGTLRVGALELMGEFQFESGTLTLTASDLRISDTGSTPAPFGRTLFLVGDQHVDVTNGTVDVGPDGILSVQDGASLTTHGGSNGGVMLVAGSSLRSTSGFDNDGTLQAIDSTLRLDGGIENTGSMLLTDVRIEGDVHNDGGVVLSGENIFTGSLSGHGAYAGTGKALLEGALNPGDSPGLVQFGGDVIFGDAHTLTMELAGLEPGVEHDQIKVAGGLTLGGTLEVALLDGYAPLLGDTFDIAIAAFIDGEFAELLLPTLADGLRWRTLQLSDALGRELYRLEVSAVPVPPAAWMLGSACVLILARVRRR